ncbi:hypothetical protein HXY33_03640 [Candidatus Bathyarchaeota archaeon]|nr:hypothetical protein [Candidatus Bathyarchaeota archaeon]
MIWLCFTVGLFLWFVGEAIWMGYAVILGVEIPYPSVADAFWLIGYIPLFVALYLYVRLFGAALTRKDLVVSLAATIILASIKGKLGKSWLLINASILSNVAGDMLFSYTTAQNTYYNDHLLDLLFLYGYIFFLLASYIHTKEL